jgi:LemA protein
MSNIVGHWIVDINIIIIKQMKKTSLLIILAIIVLLGLYVWSTYNGLIKIRETAVAQFQQVETQYQRRFDLIPGLISSTEAVMKQEQKVFKDLADARSKYAGASSVNEKVQATQQVESALARLLVVVENYPTLKSSDAVRDFMTQLEGTENRIATERQRYNEAVQGYTVAIKTFPRVIFAGLFGFDALEYFQSADGAENAPKVEFTN